MATTDHDPLPNPHPGEILLDEFLKPMRINQSDLARAIVAMRSASWAFMPAAAMAHSSQWYPRPCNWPWLPTPARPPARLDEVAHESGVPLEYVLLVAEPLPPPQDTCVDLVVGHEAPQLRVVVGVLAAVE